MNSRYLLDDGIDCLKHHSLSSTAILWCIHILFLALLSLYGGWYDGNPAHLKVMYHQTMLQRMNVDKKPKNRKIAVVLHSMINAQVHQAFGACSHNAKYAHPDINTRSPPRTEHWERS